LTPVDVEAVPGVAAAVAAAPDDGDDASGAARRLNFWSR
jgi:hypothetical protein